MAETADFEALLAAMRGAPGEATLVVTGAGVSLASGIPTFRGADPGAVWANDVTEKGTRAYFKRAPDESWLWYLKPTPAPRAEEALPRLVAALGP